MVNDRVYRVYDLEGILRYPYIIFEHRGALMVCKNEGEVVRMMSGGLQ